MLPAVLHPRGSRSLSHAEILAEFDALSPPAPAGSLPIRHRARASAGTGIIHDLSTLLSTQSEWSSVGALTQLKSTPRSGSQPYSHQRHSSHSIAHYPLAHSHIPFEQRDSAVDADSEGFGDFVRPAAVAMATVSSWNHPLGTASTFTAMTSLDSTAWGTTNYTTTAAATNSWSSIGMQIDTSNSGAWGVELDRSPVSMPAIEKGISRSGSPLPLSGLSPPSPIPISPCDRTASSPSLDVQTTTPASDNQYLTQERAKSSSAAPSSQDYTEIMDTWAAGLGKAKSQLQETVGFLLELQSYKLTSQQLSQLLKDHSRVCLLLQGTIEIHAFAQRVHQAVIAHKNSLCPEAVVDIITQYAACQRAFDQLRDWLQEHKDCLGSALADQCAAPCSDHQLSQCGFCLQGIFQRTKGLGLMSAGLVHYAGSDYHAGCINFWLRNCASL